VLTKGLLLSGGGKRSIADGMAFEPPNRRIHHWERGQKKRSKKVFFWPLLKFNKGNLLQAAFGKDSKAAIFFCENITFWEKE